MLASAGITKLDNELQEAYDISGGNKPIVLGGDIL